MPGLQTSSRRRYRSEQRARQAHQTRERILAAAGAEFARRGYAATRIRAVAEAAGVSVPTVELVFGTKAELLRAAIRFAIRGDAEATPMLERPWARRAQQSGSVEGFLAVVGDVVAESQQRSAGLILAAFEAAHQDESMSALATQLGDQRAETSAWLVDRLIALAPLRGDINRRQAIDTVWLLIDPHGFRALTRDRGWAPTRYKVWLIDSIRRLLLAEDTGARAADDAANSETIHSRGNGGQDE